MKKNPKKSLEIAKASVLEIAQKFMKWTQMTLVLIFIIEKNLTSFFLFGFLKLAYFPNVILKNRSL